MGQMKSGIYCRMMIHIIFKFLTTPSRGRELCEKILRFDAIWTYLWTSNVDQNAT